MRNILRYYVPWAFGLALLFYLSTRNQNELPQFDFPFSDKIFHFVYYLGLGFVSARLSFFWLGKDPSRKRLAQLSAVLAVLIYGLIDEWVQSFSPGRDVEFWDIFADFLGGCAAALIFPRYRDFVSRIELQYKTFTSS